MYGMYVCVGMSIQGIAERKYSRPFGLNDGISMKSVTISEQGTVNSQYSAINSFVCSCVIIATQRGILPKIVSRLLL